MSIIVNKDDPVPHLLIALIPIVSLVGALWVSVVYFRELELTTHVPLILATIVAAVVALLHGYSWRDIEEGMVRGIGLAMNAILIMLVIGVLVATWIQAGIVPTMIAYGLDMLSPSVFLAASCLICALVSLATGSSWSTAATVGIALIGVGEGLGIPRTMVAGAIISGAYFGDKMSPLSDTTNLAPAMVGADLFDHVRHMIYTTGPSLVVAVIAFAFLGSGREGEVDTAQVDAIRSAIKSAYSVHPLLFLGPGLVILMVVLRIPALPALTGGSILGAIMALTVQGVPFGEILSAAYSGVTSETGNKLVDGLLSRGGLTSMFSTVALIICALSFGGVMERSRMLEVIARAVLGLARGVGGLVLATLTTCMGMNLLVSDQYLAIVIPGRMYREAYEKKGLAPKNLSRALEDSGTLTSALIPWNTCGAFMIATLGLAPWTYVPYCFLNLINPFISAFYGFSGLTMHKTDQSPKVKLEKELKK
ncbi:MAG: Na+/H+ antiporter NhaC [Proteobacteria bacterium]|nr:Na+/H+ antiporter NhaC [Pseudomonadota bacterium]